MDDMTVDTRLILARYEDIAAQYSARVNEIGEEFAQSLAKYDAEAAERDRIAAEQQPAIDAAHQAAKEEFLRAQQAEEKPSTWALREARPMVLSFGGDEVLEEAPRPVPVTPVAPPASFAPPEPVPAPEPAPTPRGQFLSFGVEDEEEERSAPQSRGVRPAPQRRVSTEDSDDDDWSGRSWVR